MPDNATIDRWIAEKVMGTDRYLWDVETSSVMRIDDNSVLHPWSPTTNIADAMEAAEELSQSRGVALRITIYNKNCCDASAKSRGGKPIASWANDFPTQSISRVVYEASGGQP